ncbi:MAG: GIY-YIG nuclease family protein [Clostridia bacterium]|nr:GIY-YIG nuclease family protein [Clostridia bacterium]
MQGTYSVYKHTAPNGKVYIGITSQNVEKRFRNGHGYSGNVYFKNSIDKYGWDNFSHEILFHGLSADEAYQKERELIAYYRSNEREYGFNLTDGGESRFHPVESSIQKMRDAKKGMYVGEKNPHYGRPCSDEEKRKISLALKGRFAGDKNHNYGKPISDAQKRLISLARTGKHYPKLSESVKKSPLCIAVRENMKRPIDQYSKNGEYIKTWASASDAADELVGRRRAQSNICSCANGSIPSAYGYIWRYQKQNNEGGEA